MNTLPNSLSLILETLRSQQAGGTGSNPSVGQFPLGAQRGNFQIGAGAPQLSSQGQATQ